MCDYSKAILLLYVLTRLV